MDFVQTVYGKKICELGLKALQKYLKPVHQSIVVCSIDDVENCAEQHLSNGEWLVNLYKDVPSHDVCLLVFETFEPF